MIRFFDVLFSFSALVSLSPLLLILLVVGQIQNRSPLFLQQRVGSRQKLFFLIKFRTLPIGTKSIPTHLLDQSMITPYGNFLRSSKLDELPQLLNVLKGDMSIVGPRPCLLTQKELIQERKKREIFKFKPGITGIAQLRGIDMKNPKLLAKIDFKMVKEITLCLYFYYILKTLILFLRSCLRLKF